MISRTVPLENLDECCDRRGGGVITHVVSRLFAFSNAHFSYSSQSFAVFPGMHGGGRGSLKGDLFLASGED